MSTRGGKTIIVAKTKSKEETSKKRGGKKKCAEGHNCPYKHEYQHDLEFTHDEEKEDDRKRKKSSSDGPSKGAFSGNGHRLGVSAGSVNSGNISVKTKKAMKTDIASAASARANVTLPLSVINGIAVGYSRDCSSIFHNTTRDSSRTNSSSSSAAIYSNMKKKPPTESTTTVNENDLYFRNVSIPSSHDATDRSDNHIVNITARSSSNQNIRPVRNPPSIYHNNDRIDKYSIQSRETCSQNAVSSNDNNVYNNDGCSNNVRNSNPNFETHDTTNEYAKYNDTRYCSTGKRSDIMRLASERSNVVIDLDSGDEDDDIEFVGSSSTNNQKDDTTHKNIKNNFNEEKYSGNITNSYRYNSSSSSSTSSNINSNPQNEDFGFYIDTRPNTENISVINNRLGNDRDGCSSSSSSSSSSSRTKASTQSKGNNSDSNNNRPGSDVNRINGNYYQSDNNNNNNNNNNLRRDNHNIYDNYYRNDDHEDDFNYDNNNNKNKKVNFLDNNYYNYNDNNNNINNSSSNRSSNDNNSNITSNAIIVDCSYSERNDRGNSFEDGGLNDVVSTYDQNRFSTGSTSLGFDYYGSEFNGYSNDSALKTSLRREGSASNLPNEHMNVQCEICRLMVSLTALDYHLRKHEKNGDLLKFKQNLEYEKSVEEEIIKRTIKEEEERVLKMAEERKKEEVLFSEVTKVSLKSSQKAEMEYYRKNIVSEPESTVSGEPSLRIRFCLPVAADQGKAPERIVRRFRTANSFQDVIHFLKSLDILLGKKWTLKLSVGEKEFPNNEKRTFQSLGIISDTNMLVVLTDPETP